MDVKIKTSKTFTDILHGPRIVILQGGTRSGKSYSAVQYLVVQALQTPNTAISIVRKSFPSLRISTLRDFREIMKELDLWDDTKWRASENMYTYDNGSTIEFLSVQDGERRKGTKRDILFVDEANELDWDDMFQLFIRTTDKTILAYNPSFPTNHWIYTQMVTHPEAQRIISTYEDNPFLEDTIIQEIERLKETSPSYWKVYGEGREGMSEGLIFDNVSIIDYIPDEAQLLGYGADWGYSNDPSTLVALFKFEGGIILDEIFYLKGLLTNELGRLIKEAFHMYGQSIVIGDSSEPRTLEEIFRMGINIKPAIKGPDSINSGIDIMKQHKIFITKKSKNMIDEFYSYIWMKDKNGDLINQPDQRSQDHAIDAARYIATYMLSQKKKNHGTYTLTLR
jgi:phage terminase large subunit